MEIFGVFDFIKINELLPSGFRQKLEEGDSSTFTLRMLSDIISQFKDFNKFAEKDFMLFFEPPSIDDRIINQFSLHSITFNPKIILSDILYNNEDTYVKVVIPKEIKLEVRENLIRQM